MKNKLLIPLFILLPFLSPAQQQRDNYSFAFVPAMPLLNTLPMREVVHSQKVVSSVGGISYDQIAKPDANLQISTLSLEYDENNFDGERFMLTVNGKKVYTPIFDWQLIPIAKFAESGSYSCFTYFGDLVDQELDKLVLDNDGHILNYHASFNNTLLGLRLMDMDLLILYSFTNDLPKLNNQYLLGAGEQTPDVNKNTMGINNFISQIQTIENDLNQKFRSYILSDYNRSITFKIQNDSLRLNEFPFYFCWRFKADKPDFNETTERNAIYQTYENKKTAAIQQNPSFDVQMFVIDSLIAKAETYQKYYELYSSGTFIDLVNLPADWQTRVDFLEQYDINSLYQLLIDVSLDLEAYSPEYLEEFSSRMSNSELLKNTNPAVWNANVNVMRYAAFFRYLKLNFPEQWNNFLSKLKEIVPQPEVKTPTIIYDTGNSVIQDAIATVSIFSLSAEKSLHCYPNPCSDFIFLNNSDELESVTIFGTDGKIYLHNSHCPEKFQINTFSLKAGVYSLVVSEKNKNLKTFIILKK